MATSVKILSFSVWDSTVEIMRVRDEDVWGGKIRSRGMRSDADNLDLREYVPKIPSHIERCEPG